MELYVFSKKSDEATAEKMKSDALQLLLNTMTNQSEHVSDEDINYSCDLFIELEQYRQCWEHLQTHFPEFKLGPAQNEDRYEFCCHAGMALLGMTHTRINYSS